jgi:hypothetical protein
MEKLDTPNPRCTICNRPTTNRFPGVVFRAVPPDRDLASPVSFPPESICGSATCLHRFIDRVFEEHRRRKVRFIA